MKRKLAVLFSVALIALPASALAFTSCRDTDKGCTLEQLVQLNKDATALGLATSERIAILQEIISKLTAQIALIQQGSSQTGSSCLDLQNDLIVGKDDSTTNGEVSKLQRFLISAGVYPEGRVTGYYGSLTAQAVVRWQKAHGMDFVTLKSGVGQMTRAKLACGSNPSLQVSLPKNGDQLKICSTYPVQWSGGPSNANGAYMSTVDRNGSEMIVKYPVKRQDTWTLGNQAGCNGGGTISPGDYKIRIKVPKIQCVPKEWIGVAEGDINARACTDSDMWVAESGYFTVTQ